MSAGMRSPSCHDKPTADKKGLNSLRSESRPVMKSFARKDSHPAAANSVTKPADGNLRKDKPLSKKSADPTASGKAIRESVSVYKIYSSESKGLLSESNNSTKEIAPMQLMLSFQNFTSSELNSLGPSPIDRLNPSLGELQNSNCSSQLQKSVRNSTPKKPIKGSNDSQRELAKSDLSNTRQVYSKMFEQAVLDRSTRKSYKHPKISVKSSKMPLQTFNPAPSSSKEPVKVAAASKTLSKFNKLDDSKAPSKKRGPEAIKKDVNSTDKGKQEESAQVTTAPFETPQKLACDQKTLKKNVSSKGTTSSVSQGTSLGRAIKARSKSIINWQESQEQLQETSPINKTLRRGETVELPALRGEEEKESRTDDKPEVKKAKLRKAHSSLDVVAHSTHAIILGKYGKFQSR